jgi:hypothetical protein
VVLKAGQFFLGRNEAGRDEGEGGESE